MTFEGKERLLQSTSSALRHSEAIPLGYALTAHIAARHEIRVLAIKGMTHTFHGIRPPMVPGDVDILVDPTSHDAMVELLAQRGWESRGELVETHGFAGHSVTLFHPQWPCSLDVHRRFPGFLSEPTETFDALWESRVELTLGGVPVQATGKAGSILILALHSLRSSGSPRPRAELIRVIESSSEFTDEERSNLATLAARTGSAQTLREVLPKLGVDVPRSESAAQSPRAREWERLVESGFAPTTVWISHVMETPWYGRPRVLFRAVWPATHDLRVAHPDIPPGKYHEFRARLRRVARGVKAAPQALVRRWRS